MRLYRSLDTYRQRTVNTLMESMIENDLLAFRDGCANEFSYLGREELPSSAGTGTPLTDTYEHEHVFLRNSRNVCRADTVITVSGDSMTPTFHNGDELLVEFTPEIDPGEIGIPTTRNTRPFTPARTTTSAAWAASLASSPRICTPRRRSWMF